MTTMSDAVEIIANDLYTACQERNLTSDQVLSKMYSSQFYNQFYISKDKRSKIIDSIRSYKNGGLGLTAAAQTIAETLLDTELKLDNTREDDFIGLCPKVQEKFKKEFFGNY